MKSVMIVTLTLVLTGCMQKGADGTYRFKADANRSADIKTDAKKLGRTIEQKTAHAADKAGDALHHAGEKLRNDAAKRH